jgi:TonB family protein
MSAERKIRSVYLPILLSAWVVIIAACRFADAQRSASEYQVKAAYLFNFAKMTHWPPQALPPQSNLVMCVLGGDEDFPGVLRETLAGKTLNGHTIEVRRARSADELTYCHLAFLRGPDRNLAAIISSSSKENILLIGEDKEFLAEGGMIALELANGKVTYELNSDALGRANLHYEAASSTRSGGESGIAVQADGTRSIKFRVVPEYPDIAAKMKLTGSVQVQALVRPDGTVKEVHVIGGHPVLADAVQRAVMKWRFEPGPQETKELLRIDFGN